MNCRLTVYAAFMQIIKALKGWFTQKLVFAHPHVISDLYGLLSSVQCKRIHIDTLCGQIFFKNSM